MIGNTESQPDHGWFNFLNIDLLCESGKNYKNKDYKHSMNPCFLVFVACKRVHVSPLQKVKWFIAVNIVSNIPNPTKLESLQKEASF